ncbi:hypothetical protein [Nocardia sp. NPDC020380]|uniref:hypothetical protein n=1 Tax=Nocardia sp. NPDC020380 TaxID=3364309 RepID=UPI00378ED221
MSNPNSVPEAELERRRELAKRVRAELERAGLPTLEAAGAVGFAGAVVGVDPGDDSLGGVFVDWQADSALRKAAAAAVEESRFDDPAIRHNGIVAEQMGEAISGILRSAGFETEIDDDLAPSVVHVTGTASRD